MHEEGTKIDKIGILLRACKSINMHCILCGCGLSLLVYYCATGFNSMDVINGNERGSRLEYINDIPIDKIKKMHKSEVFLDNTTGDFYELSRVLL